jgi:hypothetical protein
MGQRGTAWDGRVGIASRQRLTLWIAALLWAVTANAVAIDQESQTARPRWGLLVLAFVGGIAAAGVGRRFRQRPWSALPWKLLPKERRAQILRTAATVVTGWVVLLAVFALWAPPAFPLMGEVGAGVWIGMALFTSSADLEDVETARQRLRLLRRLPPRPDTPVP